VEPARTRLAALAPPPEVLTVNVCAATRILIPAVLVALVLSTLTTNEVLTWLAAAATAIALYVAGRTRGPATACNISPPAEDTAPDRDHGCDRFDALG
jgi:hypothetical protein